MSEQHGSDPRGGRRGGDGGRRDHRRDLVGGPRRVAEVLGFLAVVVLLLWGADFVARVVAQSVVAGQVQDAAGTPSEPDVDIGGLFFLPQLIRGVYDDVHVTASDVSEGPLPIQGVEADLTGVHVPFHDVLTRDISQVEVDHAQERVLLTYDALNGYLEDQGRQVRLSSGPEGEVQVDGTFDVVGQSLDVSANVTLEAVDGELRVTPREFLEDLSGLGSASRALLGQRLTFAVPLADLPFGSRLTGVDVAGPGVVVTAESSDVVVQP